MHGVTLAKHSIESILQDFYMVTGIRIAFVSYDQSLWIEMPKEKAPFCSILRLDTSFEKKCSMCDKNAFEAAKASGGLYMYKCHAGLVEAVSPIVYEGKLLGYLMLGQTLDAKPDKELWELIKSGISGTEVDFNQLEKTFYQLKCLDRKTLEAATRIMDISAKYIHLNNLVRLKEPQYLEKIRRFTEDNLSKDINVNHISQYLMISSSYLSHIIKASLNMSFTEYLTQRRVEKAKQLLEQSTLKIHEISTETGFNEQNYFTRIFKRSTGLTPTQYRNKSTK